jgi:parallel beta-helix repeat protein
MKRTTLLSAATPLAVAAAAILAVGDLNPPAGAVAETGKRLTEVEPRIAINSTTTPGDADSTFRISQPGSYYLTGNVVGLAGRHGIEIAASSVTLDLGGFTVDGTASGSGGFDGIRTSSSGFRSISIVNGIVSSWDGDGIDISTFPAEQSLVERIHARENIGTGIRVGGSSIVDRCTATLNAANGLNSGASCTITNCTVSANGETGFLLASSNLVSGCTARLNGGNGFSISFDGTIRDCVAVSNTLNGMTASYSSILDCTTNLNRLNGIAANTACLVRGNTCSSNGVSTASAGILVLGSDNRLEDNNCTQNNSRGIDVNGSGNIIVRNTCASQILNWEIAVNNVCGPILDRRAPASAAVNGDSAPDSTSTSHPNANFSY